MKFFLKINSESYFSNKLDLRRYSYSYIAGDRDEVSPIIKLNKYYIFKMKDAGFDDFVFYTEVGNIYEDR